MKFNRFNHKESKQYVAHMMYQLGIQWTIANKIGTNEDVFTALNIAQQRQNDESYDLAFNLLQSIKGIGESRAELYIEKYFENPYLAINWKMFELLKKYQKATKWTDKKIYDLAKKIDDPSEIWEIYLDDNIELNIAVEIYKMSTLDSEALQSQTVEYFVQHYELRRREKEDNTISSAKFMYNGELNEKYGLFLEIGNSLVLRQTAINYREILTFFKENKENVLNIPLRDDVDTSDFGEDQIFAFNKLIDTKTMLLTGFAGTGKTYMLDKYIEAIIDGSVYITSLAGKAVKNFVDALSEDSKIKTRKSTIAGLKYVGKYLKEFQESRVCIVDEASMISMNDLSFLIRNLNKNSKLVLIGDINQLPAIELDVLNWVTSDELIESVVLDIPKRQTHDSGIFKDSMKMIKYPKTKELPDFNTEESQIRIGATTINAIIEENRNADIFLTTTNKIKDHINRIMSNEIRMRKDDGHSIFENEAFNKEVEFHEGEKIMIGANNADTGLMNGDIFVINFDGYLCDPVSGEPVKDFDDRKMKIGKNITNRASGFTSDVIIDISSHKVQLAFAITTHKSQGSTLSNGVTIMAPGPLANRNLIYTALTRFKNSHVLYIPNEELLIEALSKGVKWQKLSPIEQTLIVQAADEALAKDKAKKEEEQNASFNLSKMYEEERQEKQDIEIKRIQEEVEKMMM